MNNYEKYIVNTNEFMSNKINLFEASTNTRVIIDNLNNDEFKDVINYVFKNKFNFIDSNNVYIKTEKSIKKIIDLEFNDINTNFMTINFILNKN